jgi:hypothetical protein
MARREARPAGFIGPMSLGGVCLAAMDDTIALETGPFPRRHTLCLVRRE